MTIVQKIKSIYLALLTASALLIQGCSEKETPITPEVLPTPNEFLFPFSGGTEILTIQTNIPLELTSEDDSWCTLIRMENTAGKDLKFQINVTPNEAEESRQTSITLLGNQYARDLTIKQEGQTPAQNPDEAMAFAKTLGMGWNLGNQLDAHANGVADETIWGNDQTTQDAFDKIAEMGISSVRIPVTWMGHIGTAPDYTIATAWLDRVVEVVGYAEVAGLNAIINIHHDGAEDKHWLNIKEATTNAAVNQQIKAQLTAMWTQIAEKFKDKGHFLIFEAMNEIHDGGWGWGTNLTDNGKQYAVLNEWNQVFVDAVRATGGQNSDRYLGIPGYVTSPKLTINHMELPSDAANNRLLVSVHYYDPNEYAIEDKYSEWGHTAAADKKDDSGDEAHVREILSQLKTKYINRGIPVYIGEMGSVHRSTEHAEAFRKYYLEYISKAARTYGLAPFYWDNGSPDTGKECFGIINHATGNFINNGQDIVELMVKAVTNDDPTYTLQTVYDSAP
jgi:endoglucanase